MSVCTYKLDICLCLWEQVFLNILASVQVFVSCQAPAVSAVWMSERAINTWGSRNTQTPSMDCIYGRDWGGGGESRHAQLSSGCGETPTKTTGLLKPPWMSPRGQWSGWNAGLGLEVQGYVLLLMSSPHWASLTLSPWHCLTSTLPQPLPGLVLDHWSKPHFLNSVNIPLCPWDDPNKMCVSKWIRRR